MKSNDSYSYVDTDILIRLLTSDDIKKQEAAASLFEQVFQEKLILRAPETVIADAVYVLSSKRLYNLPKIKVRDILSTLIKIPNFKVENKQVVLNALDVYVSSNIDFGDALLVSYAKQRKIRRIYSYDHDFDKIHGIKRLEP